jgi:hypothetical protein
MAIVLSFFCGYSIQGLELRKRYIMTVSINLPADTEAILRQQAAAAGKDLTEFVQEAIEEKLAAAEGHPAETKRRVNQLAKFHAWVASHAHRTAIADDSRDEIYGDERD